MQSLAAAVTEIMTHRVTLALPAAWQGEYTPERAQQWVEERDGDGLTLLAVSRAVGEALGLVIIHETVAEGGGAVLRIGYMLGEGAWGKGFGTELVGGLVAWAGENGVTAMLGGVDRKNLASQRVLEKNGFKPLPVAQRDDQDEIIYQWTA